MYRRELPVEFVMMKYKCFHCGRFVENLQDREIKKKLMVYISIKNAQGQINAF